MTSTNTTQAALNGFRRRPSLMDLSTTPQETRMTTQTPAPGTMTRQRRRQAARLAEKGTRPEPNKGPNRKARRRAWKTGATK